MLSSLVLSLDISFEDRAEHGRKYKACPMSVRVARFDSREKLGFDSQIRVEADEVA